jgi:hypothetical protein
VKRIVTFTFAAMAFAAAPLATVSPAAAAESVTIDTGGIAFGYSDGYWDRGHQWHQWRDQREAQAWREKNAEHYYDRRHDREKDGGWRDDSWWNRH